MAIAPSMSAPKRRLVFGFNVLVQSVLAVVLVVVLIALTDRVNYQADMTGTRRNSLSLRTVKLLKGLSENVRITAVFPEPDKRDELSQKRYREIRDLLSLYERAGGARVTTLMLDPSVQTAETKKLLDRVQALPAYADEARPHREALQQFGPVNQRLGAAVSAEVELAQTHAQANPSLGRAWPFLVIHTNLRQIVRNAQTMVEKLEELTQGDVPRYGQAVEAVREYLRDAQATLQESSLWMRRDGLAMADLTPEARAYLEQSEQRFAPVLEDINTLLEATRDLKDVEIERIYTDLTRWRTGPPVLVENGREARVIPNWQIWRFRTDERAPVGPEGDATEFDGESAISSAILQLVQTEKTAVIFVRYGGEALLRPDFSRINPMMRQMPEAPYQDLNQLLESANFLTAEWDVETQKTPPAVEGAARRVYVVFPPAPPQQANPMQPPPPGMSAADRQLVLDAAEASGMAIFMAGWAQPAMAMPGAVGRYEFADYLKSTWGIEVLYDLLVLHFMAHPERKDEWFPAGREPMVITTDAAAELTGHPIGGPLSAVRAAFPWAAPLKIAASDVLPAGEKVAVIARTRETTDVWACRDLMELQQRLQRNQGVRPGEMDLKAPFPLAVAAEKAVAADGAEARTQRIVVISGEGFASDNVAQARGLQQVGNRIFSVKLFPANGDLFVNALHWLTGESDRIAVGPHAGELPRLSNLDEAWAKRLPYVLVGIWPGLAVLLGLAMWLVRRR